MRWQQAMQNGRQLPLRCISTVPSADLTLRGICRRIIFLFDLSNQLSHYPIRENPTFGGKFEMRIGQFDQLQVEEFF